ncbi:MAG: cyclase family protein [Pyrinomonadaceae bacterium]
MIISIKTEDQNYRIDAAHPLDISVPLRFNGPQPNAYDVEEAVSEPCRAGEIIGDVRLGGSCNFEQYKFIPHCNGTHTECVGHITRERISVRDCLTDVFIPAILISVEPESARKTKDTYPVKLDEPDLLITKRALETAIRNPKSKIRNPRSLIVRTLPNDESKLFRRYMKAIPPFFSTEAMELIVETGIKHLLTDLPSIDRTFDEGKLDNHRIFWNVRPGGFDPGEKSRLRNTITELIFVPGEIGDGDYLLNLQIAPFETDAAPSRPLLFRISDFGFGIDAESDG